MREIYGSHLKLMDLFRLYVGAPPASPCWLNLQRRRIRLQISKSWVLLQKVEKKQHLQGEGTEAEMCVIKDNAIFLHIVCYCLNTVMSITSQTSSSHSVFIFSGTGDQDNLLARTVQNDVFLFVCHLQQWLQFDFVRDIVTFS